ncbi:hypothetical protein [uncultured Thiobacillus sp.]|nr:hypothetical protein [uncultured Thiobacillus sp.]
MKHACMRFQVGGEVAGLAWCARLLARPVAVSALLSAGVTWT